MPQRVYQILDQEYVTCSHMHKNLNSISFFENELKNSSLIILHISHVKPIYPTLGFYKLFLFAVSHYNLLKRSQFF